MARLASCPHCEHDLLVPDDAAPSARVKCPQCRAFFELQQTTSRELPTALIVDAQPLPTEESYHDASSTVTEPSSLATLSFEPETITELEFRSKADRSKLDQFNASDELKPADSQSAEHHATDQVDPVGRFAGFGSLADEPRPETPEEAAKRIDDWFRSAKTISDVPPVDLGEFESVLKPQPTPALETELEYATNEAIDDGPSNSPLAELSTDFDRETPAELRENTATWDDSQHMDRLLADLEGEPPVTSKPADTFEPSEGYDSAGDYESAADAEDADHKEGESWHEHFRTAAEWAPDETIAMSATTAPDRPERKRSSVRTLSFAAIGGIIGLGLGYYALLWLGPAMNRGKEMDFLEVAQYLPKAILPSEYHKEAKTLNIAPPSTMKGDVAGADHVANTEPAALPEPAVVSKEEKPAADIPAAETVAKAPGDSSEKQASFTTPAEPAKKIVDSDERYAIPAKPETTAQEPAPLATPPAKAMTEISPVAESIRIRNAPDVSAAEVDASLAAAKTAEAGLVMGNLQDGKEIARTKGISYMTIADFAQKATFADAKDAAQVKQQADQFFKKLFSDAHAREEVSQIAPRWLSHPTRPQNGVFLAGIVKHADTLGQLTEYTVELSGGATVTAITPAADSAASSKEPKGAIGLYGAIVDKPVDKIPGYSGKNSQVIFTRQLFSVE